MAIQLNHFDTKTRTSLNTSEEIDSCMAEYLFPDASFAIGQLDPEKAQPEELRPYNGYSLQFSSTERLYYADTNVGESLFPIPSDRAAYGSLPFTPLKSLHQLRSQRVLVIDDETGDSGGVISNQDFAKSLVADCWGKMSFEIAETVTNKDNVPIQFRLGIRPQEGNDAYRIAKGTLAPDPRLSNLGGTIQVTASGDASKNLNLGEYDLILSTSMFKGRKGADAIAPGSHVLDLGLGLKAEAGYGRQKLGVQVLVNYPQGVEADILPQVKDRVEELKESLGETHRLAKAFIDYYEEKKEVANSLDDEYSYLAPLVDALVHNEDPNIQSREETLYRLLKTDLDNYGQLLDHPYVLGELKSFVQNRWHELGFSGGVKFNAALAQPGSELESNEVCVPHLPDGAELIVTRSPLINSNGVILLQNRHIPHLMRIDGSIHINPTTAAKHLQADFDGDRLAYDLAEKYPTLTQEIREKLSPQQRYPDVVKRDKVPYQGSFEEIAIQCATNNIGLIANQIMRSVAIENDTRSRPQSEQPALVRDAARYYETQLDAVGQGQLDLPEDYLVPIKEIAQLHNKPNLTELDINTALENIRTIQRLVVGELANELQIAADGPKSATRPNLELVRSRKLASNVIDVDFIPEKSNKDVFNIRPAQTSTYSPIDTILRKVNQSFEQVNLEHRPAHTFRSIQPKPSPEAIAIAAEIKDAYNEKLGLAMQMKRTLEGNPEKGQPYSLFRSPTGKPVTLTRLDYFDSQQLLSTTTPLEVSLIPKPDKVDLPNTLVVQALIEGQPRIIGAVSLRDTQEQSLKPSSNYTTSVSLKPAITDARIEAAWRDLDSYAKMLQREHTPEEKRDLTAALWHQSHTRDGYGKKKALVAFRLFPDEAISPLEQPQFQQLDIIGFNHVQDQELVERLKSGAEVTCEIVEQEISNSKGTRILRGIGVAGTFLGTLTNESPSYPLGTSFKANVKVEPPATVTATLADGTELKIKNVRQYAYRGREFRGNEAQLSLRPAKSPDNNRTGLHACVFLNDRPLGFLDNKSEKMAQEKGLWQGRSRELAATLTSPPPNSATFELKLDTIIPPWQRQEQTPEPSVEDIRARLKTIYDGYANQVREQNPALPTGGQFDTQVARRAIADGLSQKDVAAIVTTSPYLTQYRPHHDDRSSSEWKRYEQAAKKYIGKVLDGAVRQQQPRQARTMEVAR